MAVHSCAGLAYSGCCQQCVQNYREYCHNRSARYDTYKQPTKEEDDG